MCMCVFKKDGGRKGRWSGMEKKIIGNFFYLFEKYLLRIYCELGIVLFVEDIVLKYKVMLLNRL